MSKTGPRVLFVIHQIGSGADGGIRSISEMIRAQPDLDKLVVTNIDSPITEGLRAIAPVQIWDMQEASYHQSGSRLRYRLAQVRARAGNNLRAWRAIRRLKADVLHANDLRAFWNTVIGARLAGAKVIFNVRDTMREGGNLGQWRRALRLCDRFLVLSKEMVAAWRRDLAPVSDQPAQAEKFAYIYSIVDRDRYAPVTSDVRDRLRAELGVDPSRPALVYVGRFDDKKAQLALIRQALPLVAVQQPEAVTYFVGDFEPDLDPYAAVCAEAVRDLQLEDRVRFMGYSPRAADWYRVADLVLLASQREGLPRCMIETLACGSAFLSFDVSSTREILEGYDCGEVVEQGDYAALAQSCAALLADPGRRARYAERGPQVVATLFDQRINAGEYRQLLGALCESKQASSTATASSKVENRAG